MLTAEKLSVYVILTEVYQGLVWRSIANKTVSQYFQHLCHMNDRLMVLSWILACPITPQQPSHGGLSENEALMSPPGAGCLAALSVTDDMTNRFISVFL